MTIQRVLVSGGAARFCSSVLQGAYFRMGFAGALVPTLPHHKPFVHQYAPHTRIGHGGV